MSPTEHATLSASGSDRWMHCPPSVRLGERIKDKGSGYAAQGTDAHRLAEFKLRTALGYVDEDPTKNLTYFDQEMNDATDEYVNYVMEQVESAKKTCNDPLVLVEQRVDFSHWVRQRFGTSDALIIADVTLHIVDLKYWTGVPVSAEDNSQLKCYSLGALDLFDDIYDIDTLELTIFQLRLHNLTSRCELRPYHKLFKIHFWGRFFLQQLIFQFSFFF